jgi:hypothetical protein
MMKIQFNTDNNISGNEKFRAPLIMLISEGLSRYNHLITRVEVHLSDENGPKDGLTDKRCMIEARPEGMQPIAATCNANTYEQSVDGAIEKLIHSLDAIYRKLNKH